MRKATRAVAYLDDLACPVVAIREWAEASGNPDGGPMFRRIRRGENVTSDRLSNQSVALVIKKVAEDAGTGHRSTQVLRRYIRQATTFDDNAATELGI